MSKDRNQSQSPDPSSLDRFLASKYEQRDHLESTKQFIGTIGEGAVGALADAASRSSSFLAQQARNGLDEFVSRIFGLPETGPQPGSDKEPERDQDRDR